MLGRKWLCFVVPGLILLPSVVFYVGARFGNYNCQARLRLMTHRWHIRWHRGIAYGVFFGIAIFVAVWAGFRGTFNPWGDPVSFTDALPAFLSVAITVFVSYVFSPFHEKGD